MQMDAGLDTGDMLMVEATDIRADDTTATLHDRLAALGGRLIVEVLEAAACGGLRRTPQPAAGVTYAHKIEKAESAIDWSLPAVQIERRVRAFDPFPGASFQLAGQPVKLWRARLRPEVSAPPGTVVQADAARFTVACGEGGLDLLELQRPGGKRQPAQAFLQGQPVAAGTRLCD
jgi:methionyl-tRNA formyltransferase